MPYSLCSELVEAFHLVRVQWYRLKLHRGLGTSCAVVVPVLNDCCCSRYAARDNFMRTNQGHTSSMCRLVEIFGC